MLPNNPNLLLSIVNTKLRDFYSSLDDLVEDLDEDKESILQNLSSIGYFYDKELNRFILKGDEDK